MKLTTGNTNEKKVRCTACLFMGLSHLVYLKEWLKGALFAAIEIIFIFSLPTLCLKIRDMVTLGTPKPDLPVAMRDNSIFMLIDGILALAVISVFFTLYFISVRSAVNLYKSYCVTGKLAENRKFFSQLADSGFAVAALAPSVLLVLIFVVVPLVFSACVAFTNYSSPSHIPPSNTVDWVGLDNFKDMFGGDAVWTDALGRVALWTLLWGALATGTCYIGGLIMAAILNDKKIRLAPVFRGIFILPYAVPSVVSMLVWQNLLNGTFGTVNRTLMALGIIDTAIPWLGDPALAKFTLVLINLWAGFPYFMLLITGTMTSIPADVYEAASIDGASKLTIFRKITLPLVIYQTAPLIIMSFTHNINNFGAIFFLTNGKPVTADTTLTSAGGTDIVVTWIYKLTVTLLKYNYASALAVLVFLVLAPVAIFNFVRTKSFKEGEV